MAPAAGEEWWSEHTRVAERRPLVLVTDAAPPGVPLVTDAPPVPTPGRHAARRSRQVVASAVPETLRGRVALGPTQLAVVAVLVALGLAVTTWWVVRGDPDEIVTPGPPRAQPAGELVALPSTGPESAPASPPSGTPGDAGSVTVDVSGKVRRPGIAVLDSGARVIDALEAAGGARPGVDLSSINLARLLVDGEQILVGRPAATVDPVLPVTPAPGTPPAGPLVDLNLADQVQLETLPEVGPVTATAIIAWRDEHGGFRPSTSCWRWTASVTSRSARSPRT